MKAAPEGTKARRHEGTKGEEAAREGTKARRHEGTKGEEAAREGTKARRHVGTKGKEGDKGRFGASLLVCYDSTDATAWSQANPFDHNSSALRPPIVSLPSFPSCLRAFVPSCVCGILPFAAILLVVLVFCSSARALEPDQIALVINDKAVGSRVLAGFYAQQRHIPAGRIIALSIPQPDPATPLEQIPFDDYESRVAQPIRDFLNENGLKDRVTCLVTFWGVPLRAAAWQPTDAEHDELLAIEKERDALRPQLEQEIRALEAMARQLSPKFAPTTAPANSDEALTLVHRADEAMIGAVNALAAMPADANRGVLFGRITDLAAQIGGTPTSILRLGVVPFSNLTTQPVSPDQIADARQELDLARQRLSKIDLRLPMARAAQREITRDKLGKLNLLRVLDIQSHLLNPTQTESAIDSELALIWWGNYPRFRWQRNPLFIHYDGPRPPEPTLMVTRIDAPTIPAARNLIVSSMDVERTGLQGNVVIDARGKLPSDGYGVYDQSLRNLAGLLRQHTKLNVTLDNREALIPPHSVNNVALYCGWYSLRHYVPSCQFSRGAVGFHVASFELIGLHAPEETGWVAGLLNNGVVATLGPVAEPYLESFPRADEFFPLLLTGKLTLAEVYWRTVPMASWMQDCIGDPLYRPYAVNPALTPEDLPATLRGALGAK